MEYTLCFGLFIIMSSCCVPYFFIKQIEVTDDGAAIDGIDVSWSLKKLGRQKESACYIQVHTNAKKGLYLLVNAQQLSQMLRKEITLGSQGLIPSARREKYLIDILNVRKKRFNIEFFILWFNHRNRGCHLCCEFGFYNFLRVMIYFIIDVFSLFVGFCE